MITAHFTKLINYEEAIFVGLSPTLPTIVGHEDMTAELADHKTKWDNCDIVWANTQDQIAKSADQDKLKSK